MTALLLKHLKVFQILGLFPISLNSEQARRQIVERRLMLWSLTMLTFFNILFLYTFLSSDVILFPGDKFGYFNDGLKVLVAQIAIGASYSESLFRRKELRKFWRSHRILNATPTNNAFDNKVHWYQRFREHYRFFIIFYGIFLLDILIELAFLSFQKLTRHLILFWSMFFPYVHVTHQRNMEFILHMEILRYELVKLQNDLNLLVDYTAFARRAVAFEGFNEFLRCKLVEKQKIYQRIYEMYENFQNAFGCSILAILLMVYVRVLVDVYFAYYTTYRGHCTFENFLILGAIFEIPAFLLTSKNCMNVVKHITYQLHNIITPTDDNGIVSTQIQNFSLQILHQNIKINGIGIVTMDGYMLTRALGSITTYMIFFIQFMPKFGNFEKH